jgi:hypothetical protein
MSIYYDATCPECKTLNLVDNGDPDDMTACDVETFRCWKCKTVVRVPEFNGDPFTINNDQDDADTDGIQLRDH